MFGNVDNIIRRFGYDPNNPNKLSTNRTMPLNKPGAAKEILSFINNSGKVPVT